MIYSYIIVLLCLTAFAFLFFYILKLKPNNKAGTKELYSEGLDMLVSGKRQIAYNNFKEIIEKDTNNVMAYLRLGQILRESGNPQKAIKIHKGLTIRKNLTSYDLLELHKNLSLDYFSLGKTDKAIEEALKNTKEILNGKFKSSNQVILEEFLEGEELSYFAIVDKNSYLFFGSAQDHKRVGEGDTGPNTGGMGAYSPAPMLSIGAGE